MKRSKFSQGIGIYGDLHDKFIRENINNKAEFYFRIDMLNSRDET